MINCLKDISEECFLFNVIDNTILKFLWALTRLSVGTEALRHKEGTWALGGHRKSTWKHLSTKGNQVLEHFRKLDTQGTLFSRPIFACVNLLICKTSNTKTRMNNMRFLQQLEFLLHFEKLVQLRHDNQICFLCHPCELFCLRIFFSKKKGGWRFFQKALLATILLTSNASKNYSRSFLYNLI